jgi:lycopene cyclase domain-containing protein
MLARTMTYHSFLLYCMVPPVALLLWLQRKHLTPAYLAINLAVGLGSIAYTAKWDSWLIEQGIWWFDPSRSSGINFGVFPLEEAGFYVLIIALGGLWTHLVFTRFAAPLGAAPRRPVLRWGSAGVVLALWGIDLAVVTSAADAYPVATFASQCLLITLPALALQLAICGDFLWHRRRQVALSIVVPGTWLSLVAGTFTFGTDLWVVKPEFSFGKVFGMIPVEMPFFYMFASALIALPSSVLLQYDAAYFAGTWIERAGLGKLRAA